MIYTHFLVLWGTFQHELLDLLFSLNFRFLPSWPFSVHMTSEVYLLHMSSASFLFYYLKP